MAVTAKQKIEIALKYAESGQYDGAHHKMWVIDQMVRALLGCPIETVTRKSIKTGESYQYTEQGELLLIKLLLKTTNKTVNTNGKRGWHHERCSKGY